MEKNNKQIPPKHSKIYKVMKYLSNLPSEDAANPVASTSYISPTQEEPPADLSLKYLAHEEV